MKNIVKLTDRLTKKVEGYYDKNILLLCDVVGYYSHMTLNEEDSLQNEKAKKFLKRYEHDEDYFYSLLKANDPLKICEALSRLGFKVKSKLIDFNMLQANGSMMPYKIYKIDLVD